MNGKLAVNIDEEALFEVLATANFAPSPGKATAKLPASVIESTPEASPIFSNLTDPGHHSTASAHPSRLF